MAPRLLASPASSLIVRKKCSHSFSPVSDADANPINDRIPLSEELLELAETNEGSEDEATLTAASGVPLVDDPDE